MTYHVKRLPLRMKREYGDLRNFKAVKRYEIKQARRALNDLRAGCAYLPLDGFAIVKEIDEKLEMLATICSARQWGR